MYNRSRGPSYGGGGFRTPPVKVGEELDVTIEAVGEKGDGIATKNGFVLFVPGVKVGDKVRIRVTKVLSKVGFAEVVVGSAVPAGDAEAPSGEAAAEEEAAEEEAEDSEDFGEETPAAEETAEEVSEETAEESTDLSEASGDETAESEAGEESYSDEE